MPQSLIFPIKINIGTVSSLIGYLGDKEWSHENNYGYLDGATSSYTGTIDKTNESQVYLYERWGLAKYFIRVPDGKYRVHLMFAENHFSAAGRRIFDVYIQGQKSLSDLDIYKEAGAKTALIKTIDNVDVSDGLIEIHFAAQIDEPMINGIVIEQISTDMKEGLLLPKDFKLEQNYPNPFNPETFIVYNIPARKNRETEINHVELKVYDTLGREVAALVDEFQQPGIYKTSFNANKLELSSGIYFYTLRTENFVDTKKMLLLK